VVNCNIRWYFDGYSHTVDFLKASSNNYATTMLSAFEKGVTDYGLPAHVHTDQGGENVWRYMMEQHNGDHRLLNT
jgi:hypothetical protein